MKPYLRAAVRAIEKWVDEYREGISENDLCLYAMNSALLVLRTSDHSVRGDLKSLLRELREAFLETATISMKLSEYAKKWVEEIERTETLMKQSAQSPGPGPSGAGG